MTHRNGQTNSGPPRKFGAGGLPDDGILSMPGAETLNVIWVDIGTNPALTADGSVQLPYHVIDDAVNAAGALAPTISNPTVVIVMPGVYTEQVTLDTAYVYLWAWNRDTTILRDTTKPLTITTEFTAVRGMTIESQAANARAILINTGVFTVFVYIEECTIVVANAANTSVYVTGDTGVIFKDCDFVGTSSALVVYFQDDSLARLEMWECRVLGTLDFDAGSIFLKGCEITGQLLINVSGDIFIYDNLLSFSSGSPVDGGRTRMEFRDNIFEADAASYDIDAAGVNPNLSVIENNIFSGLGLHPNVGTLNPRKFVGAPGMRDYYSGIADVFVANGNDPYVIELLIDVTLAGALAPGMTGPVTLEGNGHTVTRANGGVILTTAGAIFRFRNVNLVGEVACSFGTAGTIPLQLLEGTVLTGRVNLSWGNVGMSVLLDGAVVTGDAFTGHCVNITRPTGEIVIKRSKLKGAAGNAAVHYLQENDELKIKYSTLWHGDGAANLPFSRSAAQTPDYRSHHSRYNTDPQAGAIFTNLVAAAQRFDSYDVQTDY